MLQSIKDDLAIDIKHTHHMDCVAEQLAKQINKDYEVELMQTQTY